MGKKPVKKATKKLGKEVGKKTRKKGGKKAANTTIGKLLHKKAVMTKLGKSSLFLLAVLMEIRANPLLRKAIFKLIKTGGNAVLSAVAKKIDNGSSEEAAADVGLAENSDN